MTFIDTHNHIYLPEFDQDRSTVIEEAIEAGVTKFLLPNVDSSTIGAMLQLSES